MHYTELVTYLTAVFDLYLSNVIDEDHLRFILDNLQTKVA